MIFIEFFRPLSIAILKGKDWKNPEFEHFELKPKIWPLLLEDFDFSKFLFEPNWSLFSTLMWISDVTSNDGGVSY